MKPSAKATARADRLRQTVLMVAVRNAGWRRGTTAVTFLVCWGIVAEEMGEQGESRDGRYYRRHAEGYGPTLADYATAWRQSQAKTYREAAAFRAAFPGEENPGRLWLAIREQVESRDRVMATAEAASAVLA
jgi:hypothetical protein